MEDIDTGDETRDGEEEEEEVAAEEVGAEEGHLYELDDKLATGLGEGGGPESSAVPWESRIVSHGWLRCGRKLLLTSTGPPGAVRLVVLELSREADGDEGLKDEALDPKAGEISGCVRKR